MWKKCRALAIGVPAAVVGLASMAFAEPTLTVPAIDTGIMFDAGDAVFLGLSLVMAVLIGLRLYKKI